MRANVHNVQSAYEILASGIRECSACPSFRNPDIKPLAPAWVTVPVHIMFIGENPSWAEGQDIPFANNTPSGQALNEYYLKPLGLSRNQVWITDLFKCRYPKNIYQAKQQHEEIVQTVAARCARLWLVREIALAKPKIVVTLSDKQVYQRLRRALNLSTPAEFAEVIGKPLAVNLGGLTITLFPMVHPDVSRPLGDGDKRKARVRRKWAPIHQREHIPALKRLLQDNSRLIGRGPTNIRCSRPLRSLRGG